MTENPSGEICGSLEYDAETGIAYLRFVEAPRGRIAYSRHVDTENGPGVVLDLDHEERLLGVEFLSTQHLSPA